jgi:hypothetical protein
MPDLCEPLSAARLLETPFGGEIKHLPADHAIDTRRLGHRRHEPDARRGSRRGAPVSQDREGEGEEAIPGEDRRRLVESAMHSWLTPAQVIIIHRREIIMHEGIAMHGFECRRDAQGPFAGKTEERGAFDHEIRPQPLAACENRVTHRGHEALGAATAGEVRTQFRFHRAGMGFQSRAELGLHARGLLFRGLATTGRAIPFRAYHVSGWLLQSEACIARRLPLLPGLQGPGSGLLKRYLPGEKPAEFWSL